MLAKCFQNIFIYGSIISICMLPILIYLSHNKTKYKIKYVFNLLLTIVLALFIPLLIIKTPKIAKQSDYENMSNIDSENFDEECLLIENNNFLNKNINVENDYLYKSIKYLPYIWSSITICILLYNSIIYVAYKKNLRIKYMPNIKEFLKQNNCDIDINKNIRIGVSNAICTPLSIGIFRKCIVFPTENIENNDFNIMIRHELTHIKNKDIEYKFLLLILRSIYWFNPIVYYLTKQINEIIELNVDDIVLNESDINYRIEYGKVLLKQIENSRLKKSQVVTSFADSKNNIMSRFYNITNTEKRIKFTKIISLFILVLMISTTLILVFPNINFAMKLENAMNENSNYIFPIAEEWNISSGYSDKHKAIDIGINTQDNEDAYIMAIQSGIVSKIGFDRDLGNFIVIESENGVTTLYGCCSKINVSENEKVNQGSVIALVGKTGMSTGLHLHLEMNINGETVNPQEFMNF